MLGKLLKYELKSTSRLMGVLYLAVFRSTMTYLLSEAGRLRKSMALSLN